MTAIKAVHVVELRDAMLAVEVVALISFEELSRLWVFVMAGGSVASAGRCSWQPRATKPHLPTATATGIQ